MVGNLKNYTKIDILRCFLKIEKPISRAELAKNLDLGEGTIRSILDILKNNSFLKSDKNGHYLSSKGSNLIRKLKAKVNIKKIKSSRIIKNQKKIAIQVRNSKNLDKSYVLRDTAVKNGAEGAIIMKYSKPTKSLRIIDAEHEGNFSDIQSEFDLDQEDTIIIAYADSYRLAEHGALAVAAKLNTDLKNLMAKF